MIFQAAILTVSSFFPLLFRIYGFTFLTKLLPTIPSLYIFCFIFLGLI